MVDSTGAATTVTFTTNFTEGRYDGTGPALTMNRATLTDFGRGQSRALNISGLTPGGLYDVWLVSHRQQNGAQPNLRERQVGTWTSVNTTSSTVTQLIDGRLSGASPQGDVFQDGVNYAMFADVVADGVGSIVFQGQGATIAAGFPDDYRLHLSGFQIADVVTAAIPEPSTFGLAALGLMSLGLVGCRRRKRA